MMSNNISYCTCGWNEEDDPDDTKYKNHVRNDMFGEHRMCSRGEWELCNNILRLENRIMNLEAQLELNCSEEVILLREKVIMLENHVEILKEKLSAHTKDDHPEQQHSGLKPQPSRLTRRRNSAG